jgi:hypothetical protein
MQCHVPVDILSALIKSGITIHRFSKISSSTCAVFTTVPEMLDRPVRSPSCTSVRLPSHNLLCPYTITIHLWQLGVNFDVGNVSGLTTESHYKIVWETKFPVSLSLHMNLYPEQHLTAHLFSHLLHFTPTTSYFLPSLTQKVAGWRRRSQRRRVVRSPRAADLAAK